MKKKETFSNKFVKTAAPVFLKYVGNSEGAAAKKAGMKKEENPYVAGTDIHNHWNDGYDR